MKWYYVMALNFLSAAFGFFVAAICVAASEADKRIKRTLKIEETTEEVIQAALDYGYVEASRSEGDYDLNVNDEGTAKIRSIIEGML